MRVRVFLQENLRDCVTQGLSESMNNSFYDASRLDVICQRGCMAEPVLGE